FNPLIIYDAESLNGHIFHRGEDRVQCSEPGALFRPVIVVDQETWKTRTGTHGGYLIFLILDIPAFVHLEKIQQTERLLPGIVDVPYKAQVMCFCKRKQVRM